MYFSARTEGRISYGHLGRTNSCFFFYPGGRRGGEGTMRLVEFVNV